MAKFSIELTVEEVARWLGVSRKTVRRYIREGRIVARRTGGRYLIKRENLETFRTTRRNREHLFNLAFELRPRSLFGIPDGDTIVVPSSHKRVESPLLHVPTGHLYAYGTLSKFRSDAEMICRKLTLPGVSARLRDNFITVKVWGTDPRTAHSVAASALERFLQQLTVTTGVLLEYTHLYTDIDSEGETLPAPTTTQLLHVAWYNLDRLRSDLGQAESFASYDDMNLIRACRYYTHARMLEALRNELPEELSWHRKQLASEIFLNSWKAITSIFGDTSKDARLFQSAYRTFGITKEFFKNEVLPLKHLRDECDVAHSSSSSDDIDLVDDNLNSAMSVARKIIRVYRDYLARCNAPASA